MTKIIQERLDKLLSNIANDFNIQKLSKSSARFNTEKLDWFNREYIKAISLQEFCHRASVQKCQKNFGEKNLRVGNYIYFVDVETQKVLMNHDHSSSGQDGQFYCIGGGVEAGEDNITSLCREVLEETNHKIKIDKANLLFIRSIKLLSNKKWERDGQIYDGKEMNFWFYPLSQIEVKSFVMTEEDIDTEIDQNQQHNWIFDWYNLLDVISTNDYLTYPIWKEFCNTNNLTCFDINQAIETQYKAWSLDKNRATVLNDFESESDCILKYKKPLLEDLKWKKISLEQSIQNLTELVPVLKEFYENNDSIEKEININFIPNQIKISSEKWEEYLKTWIKNNNKDAGSYFWPLRVALSGKQKSPSPFEILSILSYQQVIDRI